MVDLFVVVGLETIYFLVVFLLLLGMKKAMGAEESDFLIALFAMLMSRLH